MTTTLSGRLEPTPVPSAAVDANQALLQSRQQARAQWAEGLAQFQAQMGAIAELSLPEVVQAAAAAFAIGFSFSAQKLIHDEQEVLRVTLRHRCGAEEFSEGFAPQEGSAAWQTQTASLLAGLLGIPVGMPPRIIEPNQANSLVLPAGNQASAPAGDSFGAEGDEWGSGAPDVPEVVERGLEALTEEEIATLHTFLAAMPPEARKRFTIAFRHHFEVPREVRTIKDRITQRRHKDFIDVFERELGGVQP